MNHARYRIRFTKAGDLRFLSHHDLIRLFERMMRRAELPFRSSQGFHPLPKMAFASALALGIIGWQEIVELEFQECLPTDEVRRRLAEAAPAGLAILSAERIPERMKAAVRRAVYRTTVDRNQFPDLPARIAEVLASVECCTQRLKPQRRMVNVRPFIRNIQLDDGELTLDFHVTPQGSARPDEVLGLLGLAEWLTQGGVIERTILEIDELPTGAGESAMDHDDDPDRRQPMPPGPAEIAAVR